jgi:hypothetical protein
MKTSEFDNEFNKNKNILNKLDLKKAKRPALKLKRINVDFPEWMVQSLDHEAKHLGVSRQAVIKTVIGEHLHQNNV